MTAVPATLRLRRESTLRSRAARGDAAAFAAVYERHHQALYRYCRSILRHEEDAQDALQSTMTRAFAALQDEQRDFELRPWLFRIAHNEAISILRKRRTTTELDDVPVLGDLEDQVSEREELRLLAMDLAELPDRQRAALVLRELNGLSHAEIAVVLETSAANVKQTIYEARTALFSAREGREMPCAEVRKLLSDGDGRVLRGRGVRAHLRSCAGCRAFREDIDQRSKRLAMLAPPLPTAGAAALLAQILGGGGAAKLLACVAIAGGGATVAAVEFYKPPPQAAADAPAKSREPRPRPAGVTPSPTPAAILASDEQPRQDERKASRPTTKPTPTRRQHAPKRTATPKRGTHEQAIDSVPTVVTKPPTRSKRERGREEPPGQVKKETAAGRPPGQAKRDEAKTQPPGQAKKDEAKTQSPGQAKKQATPVPHGPVKKAATAVPPPPGQAKKDDPAAQPPGQAKKDDPAAQPPGQAKKDDPAAQPPGQAKKDDPAAQPPGQAKKDKGGDGDG